MEPQAPHDDSRPRGKECPDGKEPDLQVEIRQYQTLLQILDKPKSAIKVIVAIVILALAIFMALAFTTIAIKRFYPYNEIKTNAFGATTMQNEEVELTYWLFNTADLWGNSGIRVERGDKLTIRASGKSNTSIHHLVDNAFFNARPSYRWVGTEGEPRSANTRTAYRIYGKRDPDALIMQVVPEEVANKDQLPEKYLRPDLVAGNDDEEDPHSRFYYIGKERTDLIINQPGELRFAVNDIVLTRRCIDSMLRHNDLVFKRLYGEEDYIKILMLRQDTTALVRLFAGKYFETYRDSSCNGKEFMAEIKRRDKPTETLTIRLEEHPEQRKNLLAFIINQDPDSWTTGKRINDLRKQCDTLKTFYHFVSKHPKYDEKNSLCKAIGYYFMTHKDFMPEFIDKVKEEDKSKNKNEDKKWRKIAEKLFADTMLLGGFRDSCKNVYYRKYQCLKNALNKIEPLCEKWRIANQDGLYFGPHPCPLLAPLEDSLTGRSPLAMTNQDSQLRIYPFYNEMTYYREANYYDAWYEDNIGSFLIVVERRKNSPQ